MRTKENEFGIYPKNIHGSFIYYFWVYDENGKRWYRSTGEKDYNKAIKHCRNLQIKGQLLPSLTFEKYTEKLFDYETCPYINYRKVRDYTYSLSWAKRQKKLLDSIIKPYFNKRNLTSILPKDIDGFIMSLKEHNYSNKTINHILSTLKTIFKFALMESKIENNPCREFKPFKVVFREKGFLNIAELKSIFNEETRSQIWPEFFYFIIRLV